MYVLIGLGNPGKKYESNRHNIGFMIVDALASAYHFSPFKEKFSAAISEGTIGAHKVILCKPLTYMNKSGQSVQQLMSFYKIPLNHVYTVHDDLDLEPGKIKVKCGGGHGGHNGLRSLDQHIGQDYWRIRLGIGHPGRSSHHQDLVAHYVLSDFSRQDENWLSSMQHAIAKEAASLFGAEPGVWLTKIAQALKV